MVNDCDCCSFADHGSLCASVGMRDGGEELSRVTPGPVFGGWTGTKGVGCVCVSVVCVCVCERCVGVRCTT